jgi:hypothetical protein
MHSNFDNLGYHMLVYAAVYLHTHKHSYCMVFCSCWDHIKKIKKLVTMFILAGVDIWDISATPFKIKREWNVCIYQLSWIHHSNLIRAFFEPNNHECECVGGRFGIVVGILACYARGRGFDFRTVQTFVCMNISVCIRPGCFYV